ncbi:pentatricopeptide repeat-containing protein At4g21170 [Euphorbia lathyris]|uniref:pentatricopeptide repeat-containing protein At4g21170 n=1 Tax=Euphorbia lathyris TaxID=212925 RepID=UPI0033132D36
MLVNKAYSTATWRIQIKQNQLVSQISSILLQRHNWIPLLQNLNLSSKLTSSLFLQILHKTQSHPQISLNFFNWAISNLKFNPDLKSQCYLINVSLGSDLTQPAKTILDSLVQTHPVNLLLKTMVEASRGKICQSDLLSFVLQCYLDKGLLIGGLEVYKKMRITRSIPSIHACNSLLDVLRSENQMKLGFCLFGAMIRIGILPDKLTWSLIAQILSKNGQFERIVKLLDMDFSNSVMYNSVIDNYCKIGDFEAAFDRLNQMCERKLHPGFSSYSSILDGACRYGKLEVIDRIMSLMVDKGFLPKHRVIEFDSIIQKLCSLGRVNATKMFFKRAGDNGIELQDATYGCLLRAYSIAGQLEDAIGIHRLILERDIAIKNNAREAFVDLLCEEDHSDENYDILKEIIRSGFSPRKSSLSKYISSLCNERRWREAEEVLVAGFEKGIVPDSLTCCSIVKHYCCSRQIGKAVELHNELEKLRASLDVETYNMFLSGLVKAGRGEESIRVFDYMKGLGLIDGASFTIVIRELCRCKEMRKAMKLHDEMLNLGLKPDKAAYKRLILEFK